MKYVIKFSFHSLLLTAFVYMFYFQGQLGNYNFWEWSWTIVTSIIGLLNFISLIAAKDNSNRKNCESDEKTFLRLAGFVDFIIVLSIWLMGINIHFVDYSFLVSCIGIFILASGINKFSFSLISFTSLVWLFVSYNTLSIWHSWLLFFIIILSCIASTIIILINDIDDSETPPYIECIGLVVCLFTFLYTYFLGGMCQDTTTMIIWLCSFTCCFIAYIRDNIFMFMDMTWFAVVYFVIFLFTSDNVYSWVLVGIVSTFTFFEMFFYYSYKKRMTALVVYMFDANKKIVKQYNSLVDNYNNMVESYNGRKNRQNNDDSIGTSARNGAVSGLFGWLVKVGLDSLYG